MTEIKVPSGTISLPAFFQTQPMASCGVLIKGIFWRAASVKGLVMNTFHLLTEPGFATVKSLGGLHTFSSWPRPILTDSGGFQIFSMIHQNKNYGAIRKNEVVFYTENKKKLVYTPEKSIQAQFAYASGIMMRLDYCTRPDDSPAVNALSVETTIEWAHRCKEEFLVQCKARKLTEENRPLLFGTIQGGNDFAL